jgi:AcrR family transcriptional regulator
MRAEKPFDGEPSNTEERIMRAAYEVLGRHGYGGLSIGRIAEEADLSKSSVYHFYDDKEDLLVAFLDGMLEWFREQFAQDPEHEPPAALREQIVTVVTGVPPGAPDPVADDAVPFGPFLELRAHAVTDPAFRERFTTLDALFKRELTDVIERGIETGTFRPVDPDRTAELLLTLLMGVVLRRSTADGLDADALVAEIERLLEAYLYAEDREAPDGAQ